MRLEAFSVWCIPGYCEMTCIGMTWFPYISQNATWESWGRDPLLVFRILNRRNLYLLGNVTFWAFCETSMDDFKCECLRIKFYKLLKHNSGWLLSQQFTIDRKIIACCFSNLFVRISTTASSLKQNSSRTTQHSVINALLLLLSTESDICRSSPKYLTRFS